MTNLPPRFVPGSSGLPILRENQINGLVHEAQVHWRLASAGYDVTNLNLDVMNNFPIADLVAHNGKHRLLIQVRGAVADSGSFRIPTAEIERFDRLTNTLSHHGVYAFVFGQGGMEFTTATMLMETASEAHPEFDPFLFGAKLALRIEQMLSGCYS